jgi:hypothetical protein
VETVVHQATLKSGQQCDATCHRLSCGFARPESVWATMADRALPRTCATGLLERAHRDAPNDVATTRAKRPADELRTGSAGLAALMKAIS